ncbi:MAG: DNA replication/repair protein RecF [Clostridia bacterium]|nr:DNA replication/repair protein RecF [Clostridia bacterium]
MIIKNISLLDYRNIKKLNIDLSPDVNVFYGDNAQGKTNILESMYMCATGRSQRTHISKELIRFGCDGAHIQLTVIKDSYKDKINIHIKPNNKKGIAINNLPVKNVNELFGTVNIILFSPEDLMLVKEGPSNRRKYIDIELCQLSRLYANNLSRYYRILKDRNLLLKKNPDKLTLEAYDTELAQYGSRIIKDRKIFIEDLNCRANKVHSDITSCKECLEVRYVPNVDGENFLKKLEASRDKDIYYGTTSAGIHKDDLIFNINGINARDFGSQGQQRTICLSLKLAEVEIVKNKTGYKPVLLLDDVLSELDRSRQLYILHSIKGVQTIITSTGIEDIKENVGDVKFFYVKNGMVTE